MKRWLLRVGGVLAVFGILGLLVAVLGLVPIAASSGHFAVTEWFLQFGKRRSVARHAPSLDPRELRAPWLVTKGAAHYDLGCRPCHASPGTERTRLVLAMMPPPPRLDQPSHWTPGEHFYIVKNGLKFTGMPAFPSQRRDDEVKAVVAFLEVLPGLDAERYERLARGDEPRVTGVVARCAPCHGADGLGRGSPAFPRLAGQKKVYLVAALEAYARGERHSGIMEPVAAALDPGQILALAEHYAALRGAALPTSNDAAVERGREIAARGVPARRVPSCADCHGPKPHRINDHYPLLAGQWEDYQVQELERFSAGDRGGSPYSPLMERAAHSLTSQEMRDVAAFYAQEGQ